MLLRRINHRIAKELKIRIARENVLTIVTALNNVLRLPRKDVA
jgi:hypothetical protein